MALDPNIQKALDTITKALGAAPTSSGVPNTAKSPAPTDETAAYKFLKDGIDAKAPLFPGTNPAASSGMYPSQASFHDAYVFAGATKELILAQHLLCLGYLGLPSNDRSINNKQRQYAYGGGGHGNIEGLIVAHFSFVGSPDVQKNQVVPA